MTTLPVQTKGQCDYCDEASRNLKRFDVSPNLYNNETKYYYLCESCEKKLEHKH